MALPIPPLMGLLPWLLRSLCTPHGFCIMVSIVQSVAELGRCVANRGWPSNISHSMQIMETGGSPPAHHLECVKALLWFCRSFTRSRGVQWADFAECHGRVLPPAHSRPINRCRLLWRKR